MWCNYVFKAKNGESTDPTEGMPPIHAANYNNGEEAADDDITIARVQRWIDNSASIPAQMLVSPLGGRGTPVSVGGAAPSASAVPVASEDLLVDIPLMPGTTLFKSGEVPRKLTKPVVGSGSVGSGSATASTAVRIPVRLGQSSNPVPPRPDVHRYFEDKTTTEEAPTAGKDDKPEIPDEVMKRIMGPHYMPYDFEEEIERPMQVWPTLRNMQMAAATNAQAATAKKEQNLSDEVDLLCLEEDNSHGVVGSSSGAAPEARVGGSPPRISLLDQSDNDTVAALGSLSAPLSLNMPVPAISPAAVEPSKEDTAQLIDLEVVHGEAPAEEAAAPTTPAREVTELARTSTGPHQEISPKTPGSTRATPSKTELQSTPASFKTAMGGSEDDNPADDAEEAPIDHRPVSPTDTVQAEAKGTDNLAAKVITTVEAGTTNDPSTKTWKETIAHGTETLLWIPPSANKLYTAIQKTLGLATTHQGPVTLSFLLGRIFKQHVGNTLTRLDVEGIENVFLSFEPNKEEPLFSSMYVYR